MTERAARSVLAARRALRDAIHGRDARRLVVIVGPCSIHDPDAALEYAGRLAKTAEALRDELLVVMRTYFEKPRTTVGWKGLINDPHLDGSCDVGAGLELARGLLLELGELGVACASEILDPFTPQFVADLLAWGGIGARTAESQTHRQLASGLSMPVGFKNGTDGGLEAAQNAMIAASHPHSFLGITPDGRSAVVTTTGNPDRHLVLRGGGGRTNYARRGRRARRRAGRGPGHRAPDHGRLLARQLGQGPGAPGRGLPRGAVPARRRPPAGAARPADRELPRAGPADLAQGRAARARRLDHRRVHRLGRDRGAARRDRGGGEGRATDARAAPRAAPSRTGNSAAESAPRPLNPFRCRADEDRRTHARATIRKIPALDASPRRGSRARRPPWRSRSASPPSRPGRDAAGAACGAGRGAVESPSPRRRRPAPSGAGRRPPSRRRARRPPRRAPTPAEPDGSETLRALRKDVRVWAGRTEALLPRLRAPFEPIERAVEPRDRRPRRHRAAPSSPGRRPSRHSCRCCPARQAALLVLLTLSLLRGWGDAVIAIEYPGELRGAFSVHLSRSKAGRAPAPAHQQPERGAARQAPGQRLQPQPSLHGVARDAVPADPAPGAGGSPSTATCSPRAAKR